MDERKTLRAASIVSGYFGPLHVGHLDLFEAARKRNGYLIVIVNNDEQQRMKKGRMIQAAQSRKRIIQALRVVDDALVSVDKGRGIDKTFDIVRARYPLAKLEFCNGGDQLDVDQIPEEELSGTTRNDIRMLFGIGGRDKADSSTRIIEAMENDGRLTLP